eukprot:3933510-Rhodomonas_salina.1
MYDRSAMSAPWWNPAPASPASAQGIARPGGARLRAATGVALRAGLHAPHHIVLAAVVALRAPCTTSGQHTAYRAMRKTESCTR